MNTFPFLPEKIRYDNCQVGNDACYIHTDAFYTCPLRTGCSSKNRFYQIPSLQAILVLFGSYMRLAALHSSSFLCQSYFFPPDLVAARAQSLSAQKVRTQLSI